MDEAAWLACREPWQMLRYLSGKASDRKLLLFACACYRRVGHLYAHRWVRKLVEVTERFADRQTSWEELEAARSEARPALPRDLAAVQDALDAAHRASDALARAVVTAAPRLVGGVWANARADQAALLRDLFGNPFRPPTLDPSWLNANRGSAARIARAAYDEQRFGSLPVLADALEEAGCENEDILAHCRGPGFHARGCWVVDLLLMKT
jgi:hypothetical protein